MKAALVFLTLVFALGALAYPQTAEDRNPNKLTHHDFFEFDILLGPGQLDALRNGLDPAKDSKYLWPTVDGVVMIPYVLDDTFDMEGEAKVDTAVAEYFAKTGGCIKFVERTEEADYIQMSNPADGECYSNLGKQGGQQVLNLPNWCLNEHESILHEMMHALGFAHEQNRVDRDEYIILHCDNVQDKYKDQYDLATWSTAFGQPYDYNSVVHYSGTAGAIDYDKYVIETKDKSMQDVIGAYSNLSDIDAKKLKAMYKCTGSSDLNIDDPPPTADGPLDSNKQPIIYNPSGCRTRDSYLP